MPEIDLGVITLRRLFTVTFDCLPHLRFTINGETYEGTTKGVRLPGWKYTITFPDQPGQKIVHITHDCTILVP
jgi:hypothetical protein